MSFDDDNRDAPFARPAVTIKITNMQTGEETERIELPELVIPASELSPEWLAARERERAEQIPTKEDR